MMTKKSIKDFKVSTEMSLGEYVKLTEKPITEEERKAHIEWVQKRKPEFEREREGAIKEEENDNEYGL